MSRRGGRRPGSGDRVSVYDRLGPSTTGGSSSAGPSRHAKSTRNQRSRRGDSPADKDGDLSMGSSNSSGGPRSRFNPYTSGRKNQQASSNAPTGLAVEVTVQGVDTNTSGKELAEFLIKQTNTAVNVLEIRKQADTFFLKFHTPEEATAIKQLGGIKYQNKKLFIKYHHTKQATPSVGSVIESLSKLVVSRYNVESKVLDLDSIHLDPILTGSGLKGFEESHQISKFGGVLCKIIQEQCPGVETISLSSNNLKNTGHFSTLAARVPNLINLSLKDNLFHSYKDLEYLNGKDFPNLKEILLLGNPLRDRELSKSGGDINYKSNIKKLFPSVTVLDMEPVLEEIQFGLEGVPAVLPKSVLPGCMDTDVTAQTTQQFLQKFYQLFDSSSRAALSDFYDDAAVFSLVVNPARVATLKGAFSQRFDSKGFDGWWQHNRNLEKVKPADKRVALSSVGPANIISTIKSLPATSHPIHEPPEKKKFVVDAFQQSLGTTGVLIITLHGELREGSGPKSSLRSFDRTFILVPAVPGSRQAASNLPFAVKNDQLIIRPFVGNSAWSRAGQDTQPSMPLQAQPISQTSQQAPQLPDAATLAQYRIQFRLTEQQHEQVIGFSKQTGLNYTFSMQCLSETGWQPATAMQAFANAKPNIPPEAFRA